MELLPARPTTALATLQQSPGSLNHQRPATATERVTAHNDTRFGLTTLLASYSSQPARSPSNKKSSTSASNLTRLNARKPSPGLAARLRALGFGSHNGCRQSPGFDQHQQQQTPENIGRIPAQKIDHLDQLTRENSTKSVIQRRGRAWSGQRRLPPKVLGDSASGFRLADANTDRLIEDESGDFGWDTRDLEVRQRQGSIEVLEDDPDMITYDVHADLDPHKYRLPDHINGNGTKAMPDIRKAHINRDVPDYDDDMPPPPLPKDTPPEPSTPLDVSGQVDSYFNPLGLQRAGSIYTLSRVSFANQLSQLTSLQLPDAESLSTKVSAIPTSTAATQALMNAAEQIKSWIAKASDVLGGLDADDDVEWAAAGGREGLKEVDGAIIRFEELVNVYVSAIEELQTRSDIHHVSSKALSTVVSQVEDIVTEWAQIRKTLKGVKGQVELAMEWEELWNGVLGDIGSEVETLSRLVFEMEERRHRSMAEDTTDVSIGELETIIEDTPPAKTRPALQASRFSISTSFPMSPGSPKNSTMAHDDSTLLALFARMQPLRASLDFLPMTLSTFHMKAESIFPSGCEELDSRRDSLESSWRTLEKDAESVRRELGEDRWVLVFRGAGRQAQKMCESVDRSLSKLKEAIDNGWHLSNPSATGIKIESYETKRTHYGPAIERVLAIIDKGVQDRLTVNGEIVRLHMDMQKKWLDLKQQAADLDVQLEEIQSRKKSLQLRDSFSSLMSNDRSTNGSHNDTPDSSPASSVIMSSFDAPTTPARNTKPNRLSHLPQPLTRRNMTPQGAAVPRGVSSTRLASYTSTTPCSRSGSLTPTGIAFPRPTSSNTDSNKPRWSSNVKTKADPLGLTFNELQLTSPSPYARRGPPLTHQTRAFTPQPTRETRIPFRSSNETPVTPVPKPDFSQSAESRAPRSSSRLGYATKITTPGPYSQQTLASTSNSNVTSGTSTPSRLKTLKNSASVSNLRTESRARTARTSLAPLGDQKKSNTQLERPSLAARPASSMAGMGMAANGGRRTSLLPSMVTRGRASLIGGKDSPAMRGTVAGDSATSASRMGVRDRSMSDARDGSLMRGGDGDRPKWR